jgi:hypothetical protein
MKEVKEIAKELMEGNVEKAAEINARTRYPDESIEFEVIEIVRQAMIVHLKNGDFEKVCLTIKLFSLPQELVDAALKQGVLSVYYDGNHKLLSAIKDKVPMSPELRAEIVNYCESWGMEGEAGAMKAMFIGT